MINYSPNGIDFVRAFLWAQRDIFSRGYRAVCSANEELDFEKMANANYPDSITVTTKVKEEINADQADIEVSIVGASLFSGQEAFKKAEEVKQLTEELIEAGIEESHIKLRNVQVDSSTFAILKTSSAWYTLKIAKVPLEKLPTILGIIGSQKNCTMKWLEWVYNSAEEVHNTLRTQALEKAIELANRDASTLGVEILGIYDLTEKSADASVNREYIAGDGDRFAKSIKSRARNVDLGFTLGNATTVEVTLRAQFRVSEMCSK